MGRVHGSEAKGASDLNESKAEYGNASIISRQLGSDYCQLMTAVEISGFTTADMAVWFHLGESSRGLNWMAIRMYIR